MSHHRILTKLHLIAIFLSVITKYEPAEKKSSLQLLTQQCRYDTEVLCPGCFSASINCDFFENFLTLDGNELLEGIMHCINQHGVRYGTLNDNKQRVVIRNLNKDGAVRALSDEICDEIGTSGTEECRLKNEEPYLRALRRRVLDENLVEGAVICPSDEEVLRRLLLEIDGHELSKMLLLKVNVQPLLLKMLHERGFPVPKLVFQGGFTVVETYEGQSLVNFYDNSLNVRLMIANELIKASLKFTNGYNGFRFYLTDMSLDNIVVRILSSKEVKLSFVDLNNVIILDSHNRRLNPHAHTHSRIDCDGCFAYVQNDICSYEKSDINLYAVCQLLLEDLNGDSSRGFLHNLDDNPNLVTIQSLLQNCVYCSPPHCENRQAILQRIQTIIRDVVYNV
ncbi:uncharacterized protein LOC134224916 [Armigeres subalbatus]|uniref:uncharacterized protein LOC134224916 n=1 Tax=Armigeres subalbatus TaxID=124917 RepID=UPI002ED610F2